MNYLTKPDEQAMQEYADIAVLICQELNVDNLTDADLNQAVYESAGEQNRIFKEKQKEMEAQRAEFLEPLKKEADEIKKCFVNPMESLAVAIEGTKKYILFYQRRTAEIAAEQQRKLDEIARQERETLRQQAEQARKDGDESTASAMASAAEVITAPVVQTAPAKLEGISTRKTYKGEVSDLHALIKYVAENHMYIHLLSANIPEINKLARAMKMELKIPGIRVFVDETIAARR